MTERAPIVGRHNAWPRAGRGLEDGQAKEVPGNVWEAVAAEIAPAEIGTWDSAVSRAVHRAVWAAVKAMRDSETNDLAKALDLLNSLVDPDDCDFDHHGGCQAHMFLALDHGEVCPVQDTKDFLDRHGVQWAPAGER